MFFKPRTATSAVVHTKQNEQFKIDQNVTHKMMENKYYKKREKLLTHTVISNKSLLLTRILITRRKKN